MNFGMFTCAACGGEFEKARSDEDAFAEAEKYFGEIPESERAVICESCFERVHPSKYPELVAETRRELEAIRNGIKIGNA